MLRIRHASSASRPVRTVRTALVDAVCRPCEPYEARTTPGGRRERPPLNLTAARFSTRGARRITECGWGNGTRRAHVPCVYAILVHSATKSIPGVNGASAPMVAFPPVAECRGLFPARRQRRRAGRGVSPASVPVPVESRRA
ncbi:hypothetical protein SLI_2666 [Streptomyces lividans 1326]|uniref:Uncharacterized protein n=1 Tax=Streptomyces lividans 1326 TaxID=1200984 RepID=A0A7U9HC53_STRLI|nr:hypothetical protein SLI_2666 [Streptomyces lividans 1326]